MPDHDERNDLRLGGWLPPYQSGDDRLPVLAPYPRRALPAAPPPHRVRRVLLACAVAVAVGVTGMLTFMLPDRQDPTFPIADPIVFPTEPEPSAPVSVRPAPSSTSATPTKARTSEAAQDGPATRRPTPTGWTHPVTPAPPAAGLAVSRTVGLEVRDLSGFRVRHRDFLGRVDRITAASRGLDRLDSRFVVRNGLARGSCVSLESVNYPGYYLRHRDFVIHLDRRDRSRLFTEDATFCPARTRDGNAIVLESINYPAKAISLHRDLSLHLDDGSGTAFVVRDPL
jgi:hypothetical protein